MTTINFQVGDRYFEWDEEKNRLNFRKHKIEFIDAVRVFEDDNRIERFDEFHSDDEERWQIIGKVNEILFVVCTERDDRTRIISARKATAAERSLYYGDGDIYFA